MTSTEKKNPLGYSAQPSDGAILAAFLFVNAVVRFVLVRINGGEYTDGILQIVQFEMSETFWPPLYPALIWLLRCVGVEPILAGRLISWAASVLLVLPLWAIARAWAGRRAALFALALYTVSPSALRWSIRVMTDMPFALLFTLACAGLLTLRDAKTSESSSANEGGSIRGRRLAWTTLAAVAATLTRYQGLLFAPLTLWTSVRAWRGKARGRMAACLAQIAWLCVPLYLTFRKFGHVGQVIDRQSHEGIFKTLLNYWYYFEMFVCLVPYILTIPVAIFMTIGLVQGPLRVELASDSRPAIRLRWLFLYVAVAILCAQSVFQSFQSRYLLSLIPLALVCAGVGMERAERFMSTQGRAGRRMFHAAVGLTICWSMGFALVSVALQRQAFQDVFEAGTAIRQMNLAPDALVFSNENYTGANGVKLAFASGRTVRLIPDLAGETDRMPPGSIVAIHSAYGGPSRAAALIRVLGSKYSLTPIENGRFSSWLVPLLPDIMEEPITHQNPLAWLLRYNTQHFETVLFRVTQ